MEANNHVVPSATRSLMDYCSLESLIPRLEGHTASAVMDELIHVLHLEVRRDEIFHAGRTSLSSGLLTGPVDVAMLTAHVDVAGETRPRFALGRAGEPLLWRASSLTPIEFVILLVDAPPGSAEGRQVSAALARLSRDRERLGALRTAPSAADMLTVLAQVPVLAQESGTALEASSPQPETKHMIALGTLDLASQGRRRWRGRRTVPFAVLQAKV